MGANISHSLLGEIFDFRKKGPFFEAEKGRGGYSYTRREASDWGGGGGVRTVRFWVRREKEGWAGRFSHKDRVFPFGQRGDVSAGGDGV